MCQEKELSFSIYILYILSEKWGIAPNEVYKILNSTGILDEYIIKSYDSLHTLGKEYLIEDISDFIKERGINIC